MFAGCLVALYITLEAPVSGMSMNPARSFASAAPGRMLAGALDLLRGAAAGMLRAVAAYRLHGHARRRLRQAQPPHAPPLYLPVRLRRPRRPARIGRERIRWPAERYDAIIVGSGAGGAAAAYRLVRAGSRVLLIEKGPRLPRDGSTLDVKQVFNEGEFKSHEPWLDGDGGDLVPEEYFNLGGKTKWYGAALLRFWRTSSRPIPIISASPGRSASPSSTPYYDEVEKLLGVRRFDYEPDLQSLIDKIVRGGSGWERAAADRAQRRHRAERAGRPRTSTASHRSPAQGGRREQPVDADRGAAQPHDHDDEEGDRAAARRRARPLRVGGVVCRDGSDFEAEQVVLAAGAMTSPRLLQRYLARTASARRCHARPSSGATSSCTC